MFKNINKTGPPQYFKGTESIKFFRANITTYILKMTLKAKQFFLGNDAHRSFCSATYFRDFLSSLRYIFVSLFVQIFHSDELRKKLPSICRRCGVIT